MNFQETAQLLTAVQLIDNRRVDEALVIAWQDLLDDIDYETAREALRLHRREFSSAERYLEPAHIRANVSRILSADAAPTDEYGNDLPRDVGALDARARLASAPSHAITSRTDDPR